MLFVTLPRIAHRIFSDSTSYILASYQRLRETPPHQWYTTDVRNSAGANAMGADIQQQSPPGSLVSELSDLHREVASLRQQSAMMLRLLAGILGRLKEIRNHEDILEHEINVVEKEIEQIIGQDDPRTATCPACGAPLEHHVASGGDRKSTRLNSSHSRASRMPSSA